MIEQLEGGKVVISFQDWDCAQITTLVKLAELPTRPGSERPKDIVLALEEIGSREDSSAVFALILDHLGSDIVFYPSAQELLDLAGTLKRCRDEIAEVVRQVPDVGYLSDGTLDKPHAGMKFTRGR
jgi:hypothetical protein